MKVKTLKESSILAQAKQIVDAEFDAAEKTILDRWRNHVGTTNLKGGAGSGHHGHSGRPGKRGGSLPGSGVSSGSAWLNAERVDTSDLPLSMGADWRDLNNPNAREFFEERAVQRGKNIDRQIGREQLDKLHALANDDAYRLPEDRTVYFGLRGENFANMKVGDEFSALGTRSTADTLKRAQSYAGDVGGIFETSLSAGDLAIPSTVMDINETMLLPGSRFRIVGISSPGVYKTEMISDGVDYINELYAFRNKIDVLASASSKESSIFKQLPIDEKSKQNLLNIRLRMFYDESDALTQRMYTGETTLGDFQEQFKSLIREFHSSSAAIGKGGWDQMGPRDWGRLGTPLREQYKWLQGFVDYIDENRDTISYEQIRARARLYGDGAIRAAILTEAGFTIAELLPFLPKDGSTECLNRCHCKWTLDVTGRQGNFQIVRATWVLGAAEHCKTCVSRNGYTEVIRVPIDVEVPSVIGGY